MLRIDNLIEVGLPAEEAKKIIAGKRSISLKLPFDLARYASVPWGSIAAVKSDVGEFPVVTGPAQYRAGE